MANDTFWFFFVFGGFCFALVFSPWAAGKINNWIDSKHGRIVDKMSQGFITTSQNLTFEDREKIKQHFYELHADDKRFGLPPVMNLCPMPPVKPPRKEIDMSSSGAGRMRPYLRLKKEFRPLKIEELPKYFDHEIELLAGPKKNYSELIDDMTPEQMDIFLNRPNILGKVR